MSLQTAYSPKAYRAGSILSAPPERLVVMLYDGARRFLAQAIAAMQAGDVPATHEKLRRAEDIIAYLRDTLDHSHGQVPSHLASLYTFYLQHLLRARLDRDPAKIERVSTMLGTLRAAWAAIETS